MNTDLSAAVAELERKLSNLIRWGTVAGADYGRHVVRVEADGLTTDWLPWMTRRAGGDIDWWAPEVGEQVLLIAPSGLLEAAVVLPAGYSDAHPEPGSSPDQHIVRYKNGDSVVHDRAEGSLLVKLAGPVTVDAGGPALVKTPSATVDALETRFTGNATVEKCLTVNGGMSVSGGADGSTATFRGGVKVENGDVRADEISLKGHRHTEQGDGADVSLPHP